MFDDQSNYPSPPANLPIEPEDILAPVEKTEPAPVMPNALKSGVLKPKENTVMSQSSPEKTDNFSQKPHKTLLIVAGVALLLLVGGFVWWRFYFGTTAVKVSNNQNKPATVVEKTPAPVATTSVNKTNTDQVLFGDQGTTTVGVGQNPPTSSTSTTALIPPTVDSNLDGDSDGLTDVDEAKYGTDPNNPDTDADGLSDGDEVHLWHTNPLIKDTDGDGFPDGQEILNGYSPLIPVLKITTDAVTVRFVSSTSSSFKYVIYTIKRSK